MSLEFHEDTDTYRLSTGRTFYANNGILGIDPDGHVSEGYDGGIVISEPDGGVGEDFSPAERAEIALAMIESWVLWGQATSERSGYASGADDEG